jgi:very-short-patch-repair endonuclease
MSIKGITINSNYIYDLPYNPALKERSKALRKARNYAEVVFWLQVRNKEFWNIDFDRQRIIGNYIVDFYVKSLELVVEIDGESHIGKEAYDKERDSFLLSLGIKISEHQKSEFYMI